MAEEEPAKRKPPGDGCCQHRSCVSNLPWRYVMSQVFLCLCKANRSLAGVCLGALLMSLAATIAQGQPEDKIDGKLQSLAHEMTFRWAELHPIVATSLGISGYDGMLDQPSVAEERRDLGLI